MKIVDLSVELAHKMPRYPSAYLPETQLTPAATHEKDGRSAQILICGTHVSTHLDAQFHAYPGGTTIDQIGLDLLIGPARVIRIAGKDKDHPICADDLKKFTGLETEERLLIDTGWLEKTWGGQDYFTEGPYLTPDAAHFIAALPNLKLLAMDFPNIDATEDMIVGKPAPNHQIILKRPIYLLENLNNFSQLAERILLIAMPPKLTGGDGCPCRVAGLSPLNDVPEWVAKSAIKSVTKSGAQ